MSNGDKARIGFIGAGWWATSNHMPLLAARDDVEMAAVCRLGSDELAQVQERYGFHVATQDFRELLEGDLDGVIVASPHTLHFEHARAVLERGLHLMCEKPMTTRAAHARELVELAQARGVTLLVPYGWHHKPFVQRAKALMDNGAVGRIEYVLCHMASPIRGLLSGQDLDIDGLVGTVVTFQLEAGSLTVEQQHALVAEDAQIDLEGLIRRYGAGSGDRTDGAVGEAHRHRIV